MNDSFNIAFIGAGNLAWHLAPALENAGHKISLVYNRSRKNADQLIDRLYKASYKNNLDFSDDPVDVIFITVNDSAIDDIVADIVLPDKCLLVHSSGCQPMDILEKSASPFLGVIYPLQTFSKFTKVDFKEIPVFLEANSDTSRSLLRQLSKNLSSNVHFLNSIERSAIHLSAVFASNFSNHMITIAHKLMKEYHLDTSHLKPVIEHMIQKVFNIGPEKSQTGPARRMDLETMDRHLDLLNGEEELTEIYSIISKHIMTTYRDEQRI